MTAPERSQAQEIIVELGEIGVDRVVQVSAVEPLFVGDYRKKLDWLAQVAL